MAAATVLAPQASAFAQGWNWNSNASKADRETQPGQGELGFNPLFSSNWDWGGQKKVASSGKTIVNVDKHLKTHEIYVSFSDRRVYYVTKPGEAVAYPIAIPRKQDDWQGVMRVSDKRVNPSWTPTPTMLRENPRLPSYVPGGHRYNPLGVRALYLGTTAYRIHGTDAPWTIGEPVSKGCIRLYNKDIIDLYDRVKVGTKVTVTWDSFAGPVARHVVREQGAGPQ